MAEKSPRYPVNGVHCRAAESTTVYSVRSPEPQIVIAWLVAFIEQHTGFEVLLDHDYGEPSA